jgi:hypothetical protein
MRGLRNERARARARLLLEAPLSGATDWPQLQEQTARYRRDAERWQAEIASRSEDDQRIPETLDKALDSVARDYAAHLFGTARRRTRIYDH